MADPKGEVLFADDDEIIREVIPRLIERLGYRVDTASDIEESVKKYMEKYGGEAGYDVVMVDLFMGLGLGGVAALNKIRQIDPHAKVIASSGDSEHKVIRNYDKYGFSGVIVKPYTAEELGRKLGEFVKPRS
jgi:two-component system cell cycle sensor histidine kinase/response regulator CckA